MLLAARGEIRSLEVSEIESKQPGNDMLMISLSHLDFWGVEWISAKST